MGKRRQRGWEIWQLGFQDGGASNGGFRNSEHSVGVTLQDPRGHCARRRGRYLERALVADALVILQVDQPRCDGVSMNSELHFGVFSHPNGLSFTAILSPVDTDDHVARPFARLR